MSSAREGTAAKRVRVDAPGGTRFPPTRTLREVIGSKLSEVRELVLRAGPEAAANLEIEVRVGMVVKGGNRRWVNVRKPTGMAVPISGANISGEGILIDETARSICGPLEFQPGIDEYLVQAGGHLLKILGKGEVQPMQRLRFSDSGPRLRWEVRDGDVVVPVAESKTRLVRHDVACVNHHYDFRIDANVERAVDVASGSGSGSGAAATSLDSSNWTTERVKRRTTYTPSAAVSRAFTPARPCAWKVDLTHVETITNPNSAASTGKPSTSNVELEFELLESERQRWVELSSASPAVVIEQTKKLTDQLIMLLNACIPSVLDGSGGDGAGQLGPVLSAVLESSPAWQAVRSEVAKLTHGISSTRSHQHQHQHHGQRLEFIGCMPVNLVRRNFGALESSEYYLTEKSDGVRYLLYVVQAPGAVVAASAGAGAGAGEGGAAPPAGPCAIFVDRALKMNTVSGGHDLGRFLGAGTVLDGEVLFHKSLQRNVYVVFDVLAIDGRSVVDRPFTERLRLIRETVGARVSNMLNSLVVARYEQARAASPAMPPFPVPQTASAQCTLLQQSLLLNTHMVLFPKQFFRKRQITQLVQRFRLETGGVHIYVAPPLPPGTPSGELYPLTVGSTSVRMPRLDPVQVLGMYHKSDGIVFQPAGTPYVFKTDVSIMKWKFAELCSVDLQVALPPEHGWTDRGSSGGTGIRLFATGPESILVECTQRSVRSDGTATTNLPPFESLRLRADVEEHLSSSGARGSGAAIVEVTYDSRVGYWLYHHIRHDKDTPNAINTALSVLMELADAISLQELEYSLLARPLNSVITASSAAAAGGGAAGGLGSSGGRVQVDENDFSARLECMKEKALAFQRERTSR